MEYTQEQKERMVLASFDVVNLINEGVEDAETIERNRLHLQIMMEQEWFVELLTPEQKTIIENLI
jgi:hypothetical protein